MGKPVLSNDSTRLSSGNEYATADDFRELFASDMVDLFCLASRRRESEALPASHHAGVHGDWFRFQMVAASLDHECPDAEWNTNRNRESDLSSSQDFAGWSALLDQQVEKTRNAQAG
jgi:hypothetical protein